MAFTNLITVAKLDKIKAAAYGKVLKINLTKNLKKGDTVPFTIILNHIYAGSTEAKSVKVPFFLLGDPKDGDTVWKNFRDEKKGEGLKQKDFTLVGTCTRQGDYLYLALNKSKGVKKITKKTLDNLGRLIKRVDPKLTIGITSKEDGTATSDGAVAGAAGAAVGGDSKEEKTSDTTSGKQDKPKVTEEKKEKLVQKYKEEKQDDAKKLGEQFDELNKMTSSDGIKKVTANIKRGRTTKKDLKAVKELNKVFSLTEKLYNGTAKQVQKKFKQLYKELVENKKKFYELSLATKQSKKSLAEILANSYYEKKQKRVATKDEVKDVQKIVKDVILMNKKRRKKAKHDMLFKTTSFVLKKTGPKNFKVKYVNQILQKKVA
jgi:hypothetical protein